MLSLETNAMKGRLLENELLSKHTSWRVGGPADRMYIPFDRQDLIDFTRGLPLRLNAGGMLNTCKSNGNRPSGADEWRTGA